MNLRAIFSNLAVLTAVGGIALAPAISFADDDKGKKYGKSHWNSAPPKKNGRHDNRDWNKNRGNDDNWQRDRNDDWRDRYDYSRLREEERQRIESQRRRDSDRRRYEDQRRWDDERRRDEERNRWEDQRRRDEWNRNNNARYDDRNWGNRESDRRQQTKNEWRNIAIASGAISVLGLLSKDSTLTFAGAAGALYSLHRYEQDRKSQNKFNRTRAQYFSQDHFYRDGDRYTRRTVDRGGERYYQFCRD